MKDVPLKDWAKRLLEDQIERLAELRNANPRDPGFKLWRQTTLTVVQRIWPGDLARSERFRRVPFSPNSPKASKTQAKEHYERGCAEAGGYLKALVVEIETQGLKAPPPGAADPRPASLPVELTGPPARSSAHPPIDSGDHYEPSPLDPVEPPALSGPVPGPIDPDLLDALVRSQQLEAQEQAEEQEEDPTAALPPIPPAPPPPAPPRAAPAPPRPTVAEPQAPQARPAAKAPAPRPPQPPARPTPAPPPPAHSDRRALKEMLGFVDESARAAAAEPAPPPTEPAAGGAGFAPPRPAPSFASFETAEAQSEPIEEPVDELGADAIDELPDIEVDHIEEIEEAKPTQATPRSAGRAESPPIEFLRRPAATAAATQRAREPQPADVGTRTPAAMAFTALAGEVARLGVPEGHRAAARAALMDMARGIDSERASWDSICQILTMCAAYPSLARRAIPLIVPFLDAE